MKIVSYRGPNSAGGLSTAVGQAWREYAVDSDQWVHLEKNKLLILSHNSTEKPLADFPSEIIDGHYKHCNEFLWPLMHDLEEYATYDPEHARQYQQFNELMKESFQDGQLPTNYFIHDYHFALLPSLLKEKGQTRSAIFWHIPWPETVSDLSHLVPIIDIVKGMLGADVIGFHTKEYAQRFMQCAEYSLPQLGFDSDKMLIRSSSHTTEIVVAPVGIDFNYWASLSSCDDQSTKRFKLPYVFSVDRVDYTKGVINRLQAIDYFFEHFPQWRQKLLFVQACGRTRPGIPAFDKYWHECQQYRTRIEQNWNTKDWQPLVWLEPGLSAEQLSQVYRDAAVMLVNPIKDGLNLTAKEYIACQSTKPGMLVLSAGAGAWCELGHYSLPVVPEEPEQMAQAIDKALNLGAGEKTLRMNLLSDTIQSNSLADWWQAMTGKLESSTEHSKSSNLLVLPSKGSKKRTLS